MNHESSAEAKISFREKLAAERRNRWLWKGLERLKEHLEGTPEFSWHFEEGGELPRNFFWRPYRFAVQDIVLGVTIIRHSRKLNSLLVDVFLITSIPEYEADSGARALSLLILTDAFKNGGSMEIRFTENVEGGEVPGALRELAASEGIELEGALEGVIYPHESRQLYIALTGFTESLRDRIQHLEGAGLLSPMLTCYSIWQGIWDRVEVAALLLTSPDPSLTLNGKIRPEHRNLFREAVSYGRAALIFGSLDRRLRARIQKEGDRLIHLEDDFIRLDRKLDPESYLVTYTPESEPVELPWEIEHFHREKYIPTPQMKIGQPFSFLIRARDEMDLQMRLEDDIQSAHEITKGKKTGPVFVLVPRDFVKLSESFQERVAEMLPPDVGLMIYPDFCNALDDKVARNIHQTKAVRV